MTETAPYPDPCATIVKAIELSAAIYSIRDPRDIAGLSQEHALRNARAVAVRAANKAGVPVRLIAKAFKREPHTIRDLISKPRPRGASIDQEVNLIVERLKALSA